MPRASDVIESFHSGAMTLAEARFHWAGRETVGWASSLSFAEDDRLEAYPTLLAPSIGNPPLSTSPEGPLDPIPAVSQLRGLTVVYVTGDQ